MAGVTITARMEGAKLPVVVRVFDKAADFAGAAQISMLSGIANAMISVLSVYPPLRPGQENMRSGRMAGSWSAWPVEIDTSNNKYVYNVLNAQEYSGFYHDEILQKSHAAISGWPTMQDVAWEIITKYGEEALENIVQSLLDAIETGEFNLPRLAVEFSSKERDKLVWADEGPNVPYNSDNSEAYRY
jgi:hypothetical protein